MMAPEGTRRRKDSNSEEANMLPFKKGAFHLAKGTKKQIVPISIVGSLRVSNKDSFPLNPGTIYIKVGNPIESNLIEEKTVNELIDITRERFQQIYIPRRNSEIFGKRKNGIGYIALFIAINYLTLKWIFKF